MKTEEICAKCEAAKDDLFSLEACLQRSFHRTYNWKHDPPEYVMWIFFLTTVVGVYVRAVIEFLWKDTVGCYTYAFIEGEVLHCHRDNPLLDSERTVFRFGSHFLRPNCIYGPGAKYWNLRSGLGAEPGAIVDRFGNRISFLANERNTTLFNQLIIVGKFKSLCDLWPEGASAVLTVQELRARNKKIRNQRDVLAIAVTETVSRMIEGGYDARSPSARYWRLHLQQVLNSFGTKLSRVWRDETWRQRRERTQRKRQTK